MTPNRAQQSHGLDFELEPDEVEVEERMPGVGTTVKATHYSDGSSTYDFGAMCGKVDYNEYGEEC